jgi:hypothetical protein
MGLSIVFFLVHTKPLEIHCQLGVERWVGAKHCHGGRGWGGVKTTENKIHWPRCVHPMDEGTLKTPTPKCRLYWSFLLGSVNRSIL